jgi:hypothetical protein
VTKTNDYIKKSSFLQKTATWWWTTTALRRRTVCPPDLAVNHGTRNANLASEAEANPGGE